MTSTERRRQESVDRYELLSPNRLATVDDELQNLVLLAQRLTNADFAAIQILTGDRQVPIAASPGVPLNNTVRSLSMCEQVLTWLPVPEVFVTLDASRDDRFVGNPWVTGHLAAVKYFAAAPLIGREGLPLGMLCVWSETPATEQDSTGHSLRRLADAVMATLDSRRRAAEIHSLLRDMATDMAIVDNNADVPPWSGPEPCVDAQTLPQLPKVAELRDAIAAGQLEVHYQPVVDLDTGVTASVEALVRWRHPVRGLIPPSEFIPFAERCGLMSEITDAVISVVLAQTAAWATAGRALFCAVNLSALSLSDPEYGPRLLARLGAHADAVTIEVTESVLADDTAVAVLRQLASRGVQIALDDFGTGYSSLASLKDLPVNAVKIDRAFIRNLDHDDRDYSIIQMILQLAQALNLGVIAEGVETENIAGLLRASGVRRAQGFLYSKPLPPEHLEPWLAARPVAADSIAPTGLDRSHARANPAAPNTGPRSTSATRRSQPAQHSVGFYDAEADLIRRLSGYVCDGLSGAGHVVVIASQQHLRALRGTLPSGWLARAEREARFSMLDVDDTVARLMREGRPDRDLFELRVGTLVRAHSSNAGSLRLYSEMGTLLSEQDDVTGALRLEALCNRLQHDEPFELLCVYPLHGALEGDGAALSEICHQHTSVQLDQGVDNAQGGVETTQLLLETTRTLLRVTSAEQAVGALMRAVAEFGGTCIPADKAPATAIPIDISLGHAAPLLPDAALGSRARRTIEAMLPGLVEDARTAADTAGRMARMSKQIDTDPLTGLGNRRGLGRLRRLVNSDTLVVLDLDHFKRVNDTHGHDAGDRVLVAFSRTLRQRLRSTDLLYRLGGEEFLVLLPDTTPESALVMLEQVRLKWTSERPLSVTFSAGIAAVHTDLDTAMRRADSALYIAKAGGRDRFEITTSPGPGSSMTVLGSVGPADLADTGPDPKKAKVGEWLAS